MSYDRIAKLVHQYVKNPESTLTQGKRPAEKEVKTAELSVIQSVFSGYQVSGDVMAIKVLPLRSWG
ncbi:MAG TPA: hypothetical protein VN370_15050 [Desulfitobacteriaceae bacterium]|jgi:hypothetical protein|nr:hypothetical protein [Desulfitobacteriaceae bacterium]